MTKKEIKLKGSMHGTKKIKSYDNPDIMYSTVDKQKCLINKINIKYYSDNNNFYIYHSFDRLDKDLNINYSGRWYLTDYKYKTSDLNIKNKTFTVTLKSIEWENFDTGKTVKKTVKIIIQFSEKGFDKLKNYFEKNNILS